MINIELEGFSEFKKLLDDHIKEMGNIKLELYNDADYIVTLEYGSVPGSGDWPSEGDNTELVLDVYEGAGRRIVSVQGFAMIRSSAPKVKEVLEKYFGQIDLSKPVKPQILAVIKHAGEVWKSEAERKTPVDSGEARSSWKVKVEE